MEVLSILGQHMEIFRKHVGTPNCLNIASTSSKNYFQYAAVPLTEKLRHCFFQLYFYNYINISIILR